MDRAKDVYTIPEHLYQRSFSNAFGSFFYYYFVNSAALIRREVELDFLNNLNEGEMDLARSLLRGNLHLGYTHIIRGVSEVNDMESIPILKQMLEDEPNLSQRLAIAGSLWRLNREEIFVDCLRDIYKSDNTTLKEAHLDDVLGLRDERAIDILIKLLDDRGDFVRYKALSRLNEIEFKKRFPVPKEDFPHSEDYYRKRGNDNDFLRTMSRNLREYFLK